MKKESFEAAVKNEMVRRNAYGEVMKGLFTDEVHEAVVCFFMALSNTADMSPHRMCLIIEKMKTFVENTAMKETIK